LVAARVSFTLAESNYRTFGSEQESVKGGILRGFVNLPNCNEFCSCGGHAFSLQKQVAFVLTANPVDQHADIAVKSSTTPNGTLVVRQ
jgi:hypothetical protein